ncbi:MAG: helix-turn-helix domain-containing protein [Tepidiformaceae bacterium]
MFFYNTVLLSGRVGNFRCQVTALGAVPGPPGSQLQRPDPVLTACVAHGWHAGRTAAALGISRTTLYLRLNASASLCAGRTVPNRSAVVGTTLNNCEPSPRPSYRRRLATSAKMRVSQFGTPRSFSSANVASVLF